MCVCVSSGSKLHQPFLIVSAVCQTGPTHLSMPSLCSNLNSKSPSLICRKLWVSRGDLQSSPCGLTITNQFNNFSWQTEGEKVGEMWHNRCCFVILCFCTPGFNFPSLCQLVFYINQQGAGRHVSKKVTLKTHFCSYIMDEGIIKSALFQFYFFKMTRNIGRLLADALWWSTLVSLEKQRQ